jgi:hypothetical protein
MNSIVWYLAIFAEAVLIVFILVKVYDAYSEIEILSSLVKDLRDDYMRVFDYWKKSINNSDEICNITKNIINTNEELLARLGDEEKKKNG